MPLETSVTYISDLNPAWPSAADQKSDGDDHLRNTKGAIKNSFPLVAGPVPIAHDQFASKDYVNQTAFSAALPAQSGNAGKALVTDGTSASWQQVYPTQAGNAGKLLTSDGTNASWGSTLKASVVRFADGTDATKLAAFDLSALTTGTTRTYALPDASGTLALRTDLPPAFPTMIVQEEQTSGTNGGASVAGDQLRFLNVVATNTIGGASLSSSVITLPAGKYRVRGSAPASGSTSHKAYICNNSNGTLYVNGTSEGNASGVQTRSMLEGEFTIGASTAVSVHHTTSNAVSLTGMGIARGAAGLSEIYTRVIFEKVG